MDERLRKTIATSANRIRNACSANRCLTSRTNTKQQKARIIMAKQLHYGTTAKVFHWLVVALLIVQYPLGKFMPDIHRGMKPGDAMTFHIPLGSLSSCSLFCVFSGASPIPSHQPVR